MADSTTIQDYEASGALSVLRKSDVAQTLSTPADGTLNALMVGAGLSKAVLSSGPGWKELLVLVAKRLNNEAMPGGLENHLLAYAYILNRRRNPQRSAQATEFQLAVCEILAEQWGSAEALWRERVARLAPVFQKFLAATKCSVIVDLNYDSAVEQLLRAARIPYVRAVGSEFRWTDLVATNTLLLWKIHGSVDAPATIVLSPTEYQLVYQVNALGEELQRLGNDLNQLWTVGVGLADDDVWSYLCQKKSEVEVFALWVSQPDAPTDDLLPWCEAIVDRIGRATVLRRDLVPSNPALLDGCLNDICTLIVDRDGNEPDSHGAFVYRVRLGTRFWKRVCEFEGRYSDLRAGAGSATQLSLAGEFTQRYDQLYMFLLSIRGHGVGPRWCPGIEQTTVLDDEQRGVLEQDFAAVVRNANEVCGERACPGSSDTCSVLVASAAQAAVSHVVALADLIGVGARARHSFSGLDQGRGREVNRLTNVFVGTNPFQAESVLLVNLMHEFQVGPTGYRVPLAVFWPAGLAEAAADAREPRRLLTEDEWETSVATFYRGLVPGLAFGRKSNPSQDVKNVPPLYPWGFRFQDAQLYRNDPRIRVSRIWSLVDGFDGKGHQYCKGGGLRDRGPKTFEIGSRGLVRVGEYDDFLAPAFYEAI
jgi:hypothetical protein